LCVSSCYTYQCLQMIVRFFFSSRRRHTRSKRDWSSDVCSSDLGGIIYGCNKSSRCNRNGLSNANCKNEESNGNNRNRRNIRGARSEERRVGKECRCGGWR